LCIDDDVANLSETLKTKTEKHLSKVGLEKKTGLLRRTEVLDNIYLH